MRKPSCEDKHVNKGAWTKQEDEKLVNYIRVNGEGRWSSLPRAAGLQRCGKSCRLRWINYLRPDLKRGKFAEDEEDLILKLHALLGNRWSLIAGRLPGRTDNEVKNYWNSHLMRRKRADTRALHPNRHHHGHLRPPLKSFGTTTASPGNLSEAQSCCSRARTDSGRVSDEASSREDCSRLLPDLNLDPPSFFHDSGAGIHGSEEADQAETKRYLDDSFHDQRERSMINIIKYTSISET